jgi:hypothetical protein
MKILYFFLFLWVIFALLDPDPDPTTQINADPYPDTDPHPKPCLSDQIRNRIRNFAIHHFICVQEQAEEEQFGPLLVGELVKHGVNATDVKKLQVHFSQTQRRGSTNTFCY